MDDQDKKKDMPAEGSDHVSEVQQDTEQSAVVTEQPPEAETSPPVTEPAPAAPPRTTPAPAPAGMDDDGYEPTDIFLWANNLVQIKEELEIGLFLFNKNNVVYRTSRSKELELHLHQLMLDPILEYVLDGADMGLLVRGFEEAEAEQNVLMRTKLKHVTKAREVLSWLKTQEAEIEQFVEEEHDLKRIKGVIARINHKSLDEPFYIVKALPQTNVMKGTAGWLIRGGKFVQFDADGALRLPPENHLMILGPDIYVFNQVKLEQLFNYNAKKASIAERKAAEIEANFKLSFLDGQSLNGMIKEKKALINKLQKIDPNSVTQDALLDHAEEMGIEMMTDDAGAILIMDGKDMSKFVNLLNDDYFESPMTGIRYEVKGKRPLKLDDEEDLAKLPSPFANDKPKDD